MTEGKLVAHLVQVGLDRRREGVGVGSVHFARGLADDIAVQKGDGFADRDSYHDEGDEQKRVGTGHDEQPDVCLGPVVGNADQDVQRRNASLSSS